MKTVCIIFTTSYTLCIILSTWLFYVNYNHEIAYVMFIHLQFLFFLSLYPVLCWKKSTMYSSHFQSEKLCSTSLRTEYINSGGLFCKGDSTVLPHLVIIYKFKLVLAHEYSTYMMTYNSTLLYILSCVKFYLWLWRYFPPHFCLFWVLPYFLALQGHPIYCFLVQYWNQMALIPYVGK